MDSGKMGTGNCAYLNDVLEEEARGGRQEGWQELRQMLVYRTQKRFPILAPLAKERAAQVENIAVLRKMVDAVIDAETIEEARRVLKKGVSLGAAN